MPTEISKAQRLVRLNGTVAQMETAFGVRLHRAVTLEGVSFRGREGPVCVPADLAGVVEGVLGLDDRPVARPYLRRQRATPRVGAHSQGGYTPVQVGRNSTTSLPASTAPGRPSASSSWAVVSRPPASRNTSPGWACPFPP